MRWTGNSGPNGQLIYLRRPTEKGVINLLGHGWEIDPLWQHRLVRSEIDLKAGQISFYRLGRAGNLRISR